VDYLPRCLDAELARLLRGLPAVSVEGAKGVGKSATAARQAVEVLALDQPRVQQTVAADPDLILTLPCPLVIDEWQLVPPVWDVVRRAVDRLRTPGQFVLTGSALPPREARIHSGAGRIVKLFMRPLSLSERAMEQPTVSLASLAAGERPPIQGRTRFRLADYTEEIVASGFPGIRQDPPDVRGDMIGSYIEEMLERDVPELGGVRRPQALRSWLAAYAAATATTSAYTTILNSATAGDSDKPARATADAYRELLTRIWILEPLPAWVPAFNPLSRLAQAPKHHLADPALSARLLGATSASLLRGDGQTLTEGSLLAALFESLAVLSVRALSASFQGRVSHLRTRNGDHEIDIIVERADHKVLALEVKLGAVVAPTDSKHLRWLESEIGDSLVDKVILNTGEFAYRDSHGTAIVPLALLGP